MTQEEAIKILRDVHDKALFSVRNALETLIPELAESEDERIRKWILEYLYDGLRKTDEQFKEQFGVSIAWLEKQKEQKPAEWSDTNELVFQDIRKHLKEEGYNGWIVLLDALRNGEFQPKQEWNEKDKVVLNAAIEMVDNSDTIFCFEINKYKVKNWLKSLPQRFSLSSWGEEIRDGFFGKFNHDSWKPSEEQMEALKHYVDTTTDGEIELLYNDLKKLM